MSQEHDQSYYEIALTNRQVMSIFVVLLVCILAAFLGGVWLGRDADAGLELASAQSISAGPASAEAPLEQLDFFTRQEEPPELAETGTNPVPTGAAGESSPAESRDRAERRAQKAPAGGNDEAPSPGKAGSEPTPAAARGPAADTGSSAGPPDALVIQVFSSTEEVQARRVVSRLREGGYPAVISPVEVDGRVLHRVRLGPYMDRDEAQVVAESVRRTYKLDTWITH
ncbi:MAG: SPOR domain-containing protein [Thermoanaerobaculia bacterium]